MPPPETSQEGADRPSRQDSYLAVKPSSYPAIQLLDANSTNGDIVINMKTISVAVSPDDYRAFQEAALKQGRPVAQLIREAMAHYRADYLEQRVRLSELPVLPGHRPVGELPARSEIWNEVFERDTE